MQQQLPGRMVCCCCVEVGMCMALPWQMHTALLVTEMGDGSGMQHQAVCPQVAISTVPSLLVQGCISQEEQWEVAEW